MFNLNDFMKEYCTMCGSQRCNPADPLWLEGCRLYQELKEKYDNESNKE